MDKDPTPLIRPLYFGPLVVVLMGFHCSSCVPNTLILSSTWNTMSNEKNRLISACTVYGKFYVCKSVIKVV